MHLSKKQNIFMTKLLAMLFVFVISPVNVFAVVEGTSEQISPESTPEAAQTASVDTEVASAPTSDEEIVENSVDEEIPPTDEVANDNAGQAVETPADDEVATVDVVEKEAPVAETAEVAEGAATAPEESVLPSAAEEVITEKAEKKSAPQKIITRSPTLAHDLKTAQYDGVIVKYKDRKVLEEVLNKENLKRTAATTLKIKEVINDDNIALVPTGEDDDIEKIITTLENDDTVEFVEPNYTRTYSYIPNDPFFGEQWALHNIGQRPNNYGGTKDSDIDMTEAWDVESASASTVVVAVIDTGVHYTHADINDNMWDGSVCVDDLDTPIAGGCPNHGWDYEDNDNDPDDSGHADTARTGHGTFVAHILASENGNSSGTAGMSRYNNIKIMAVKFDFDIFTFVKALNFAKNNNAQVVNASFGGYGYSSIEKDAIDAFPGMFIAAAGNDDNNNDTRPSFPCSYTSENIICVAASEPNDEFSEFTNDGITSVDIAAPGVNIIGLYQNSGVWDYYYGNGTSFSTPFVTGAAALLYGDNPSATISSVRHDLLTYSNKAISAYGKNIAGNRRLNVYGALTKTVPAQARPIYRFYSRNNRSHFFTSSVTEKDSIEDLYEERSDEWNYEGVAYYAYKSHVTNTTPVYRFYSPNNRSHFYTKSVTEKNHIIATYPTAQWRYEGIAWYVHSTAVTDTTPVYRFYSPNNRSHFYTKSVTEKNNILATYPTTEWRYEGIAWYIPSQ